MIVQLQPVTDGIDRLELSGRLDNAGVAAIDERLATLFSTCAPRLLIDLSQVGYLTSMGIRSLLTGTRTLKRRGGTSVLLCPQPLVEELLKMTGIDLIVPIFRDADSAQAALQAVGQASTGRP